MNPAILSPTVQQFLSEHALAHPADIALRKSPFDTVSAQELAQQVESRQRMRRKLPLWHDTPGIYYPERLSVEQASSALAAAYKSGLVPTGARVMDMTGGFGVDAFFFAKRAETVIHWERNESLARIAEHNAAVLGARNIAFRVGDGLAHLQQQRADAFDVVYVDPSRRVANRKVFLLEDAEPDVVDRQGLLLDKARLAIVKTAPMLDVSAALAALHHVREVHVVSVDNECKELLFVLDRAHTGPPLVTAALLGATGTRTFAFRPDEEKTAAVDFAPPLRYLYEPDAALLKAGAFRLTAQRFGLAKLHRHTHLYTSASYVADFAGRTFAITDVIDYGDFKKGKSPKKGHVAARNFPLTVDALRRRHRIGEDNDTYLFFCTGPADARLVIFASKS